MPGSEEHLRGSKSDEIDVLLVHDKAKWGGGRVKIANLQRSTHAVIVKLRANAAILIGDGISVANGDAFTLFPNSLSYHDDGGVQVDVEYGTGNKNDATIKLALLDFGPDGNVELGDVGTCIANIRDNGRVRRLTAQLTVTNRDGSGTTVDLKVPDTSDADRRTPFVVVLPNAEYARNVLEDDRITVRVVHGPTGCDEIMCTVRILELKTATEPMYKPMKVTASLAIIDDNPFPVGCMLEIQSNTVHSWDGGKVYAATVVTSQGDLSDAAWEQRKKSTYRLNVNISLKMIVSNADDGECQIVKFAGEQVLE
eukprot:975114_1